MLAPLLTPKASLGKDVSRLWDMASGKGHSVDKMSKPATDELESPSWKRAGEYGLMGLLALGMCYVLLLANGNADFGVPAPKPAQAPWPQPRQSVPGWLSLHMSYVDRLADSSASQHYDVMMYGDTLVEAWRGTILGEPSLRVQGCSEIFHSHFGHKYSTAVYGIAGDATANLMWRLQNGELRKGLKAGVVVLHIGSSDLTYASFQGDAHIDAAWNSTAIRTARIAEYVAGMIPSATVLVVGLLPRGDVTLHPTPDAFKLPSKFTGAINRINSHVQGYVEAHSKGRIKFVDCRSFFLSESEDIDEELMPDSAYPNASGMEQLAQCMQPAIQDILGHRR
ncbi:g7416 [Coccomyxa viridis]|uniref:G7416 protein n=1 Tax=Coccomyxa viridis TaxID=1274662 RepID=A0ABP1G076_9CHLO